MAKFEEDKIITALHSEKAEEYYEDNECYSYLSELEDFEAVFDFVKDRVKKAYLDGLTEGRKEKWHYLRKNPDDLPEKSGEYWCKWEDGTYCTEHYFTDNGFGSYVIAWCELPKFEE